MLTREIFIVLAPGAFVLGAYTSKTSAEIHAKSVTGAQSVPCELFDQLESAREIFIIIAPGLLVLGAYTNKAIAEAHAAGASVVACELLDHVPNSVRDDLNTEYDDDEDTPVEMMDIDDADEP